MVIARAAVIIPPTSLFTVSQNVALDRILRRPPGFELVFQTTVSSDVPNTLVRLDAIEVVTLPGRLSPLRTSLRIMRDMAREGGRPIAITFLRKRERRTVPRTWQVPGIIADNPVWRRFFGDNDTIAVPFTGENVMVDVWRIWVVHNPLGIAFAIAVLILAIGGLLVAQYLFTGDLSSVLVELRTLIDAIADALGQVAEAPFRGATNTLLLYTVAGGVIAFAFILASRSAGIPTTSFTPPSPPAVGVQVGPPVARITAGVQPSGGRRGRS